MTRTVEASRYKAVGDDNQEFTIIVWVKMHFGSRHGETEIEVAGETFLTTSDGLHAEHIDSETLDIVLADGTHKVVHKFR
jgi:hypothetical protein